MVRTFDQEAKGSALICYRRRRLAGIWDIASGSKGTTACSVNMYDDSPRVFTTRHRYKTSWSEYESIIDISHFHNTKKSRATD
jgi:hypothetical protein